MYRTPCSKLHHAFQETSSTRNYISFILALATLVGSKASCLLWPSIHKYPHFQPWVPTTSHLMWRIPPETLSTTEWHKCLYCFWWSGCGRVKENANILYPRWLEIIFISVWTGLFRKNVNALQFWEIYGVALEWILWFENVLYWFPHVILMLWLCTNWNKSVDILFERYVLLNDLACFKKSCFTSMYPLLHTGWKSLHYANT